MSGKDVRESVSPSHSAADNCLSNGYRGAAIPELSGSSPPAGRSGSVQGERGVASSTRERSRAVVHDGDLSETSDGLETHVGHDAAVDLFERIEEYARLHIAGPESGDALAN